VQIERRERAARGIRFAVNKNGVEIARAYLYVLSNDMQVESSEGA